MTRHDGLHNTYHTCCHSIGTYDMVQEDVSSRASFIIEREKVLSDVVAVAVGLWLMLVLTFAGEPASLACSNTYM